MHFKTECSLPIGVFDSGIGGLSVLHQLRKSLPSESFIYLGDTARAPYGNQMPKDIFQYSLEGALFLKKIGIKLLVIACHTVSAISLPTLYTHLDIPIIGIVEPTLQQIASLKQSSSLGLVATQATINSQIYQNSFLNRFPHLNLHCIACPLLVHLVEEDLFNHPMAHSIVKEYVKKFSVELDTLLLCCTHFAFLTPLFKKVFASNIYIMDPSKNCALAVTSFLKAHQLQNLTTHPPYYNYYISKDPENFLKKGKRLLQLPFDRVEAIGIETLERSK